MRSGPTRLPSIDAWLVFNSIMLLVFGVFYLGIGIVMVFQRGRLDIATSVVLLASISGFLHFIASRHGVLRRILSVSANSLYALILGSGALGVARDGDVVGAIVISAAALGFFVIPGLAAVRSSG